MSVMLCGIVLMFMCLRIFLLFVFSVISLFELVSEMRRVELLLFILIV